MNISNIRGIKRIPTTEYQQLSDWTIGLLSEGRLTFTIDEAMQSLGLDRGAFLDAAKQLQGQTCLVTPKTGFYVIVPPYYFNFGAPMPYMYIDELMNYENRRYYVALRKAAEYQGATHHGVMEFQVMTDKVMPMRNVGGTNIAFFFRNDFEVIESGVEVRQLKTGRLRISSPELTAYELLCYPRSIGTINNITTILVDLGEGMKARKLGVLSQSFKRSIIQRLGYLLDWLGYENLTESLQGVLGKIESNYWVELDPHLTRHKEFAPDPVERNRKWRVVVRREPDPDY